MIRVILPTHLRTLARIGTPKARQTLDELSKHGGFFLRRMAAAAAAKGEE